jgi:hypothetical protein
MLLFGTALQRVKKISHEHQHVNIPSKNRCLEYYIFLDMSAYIILETNFVRLKTDMHLNIHKTLVYVPQTKRRVPVIKTNPL